MKKIPEEKDTKTYRVNERVIYRVIEDEAAVVKPDDGSLIMLNETGTFILKNLKKAISIDKLTQKVLSEYDISREKAEKDVKQFIKLLLKEGIIVEIK
ncbi:MAG: PqqD family protein [Myxococcota bacterium]